MKKVHNYMMLFLLGMIFSCTKSDETQQVGAPEVSYNENVYQTPFRTMGNSIAPTISWNGDVGLFSLDKAIQGVSIDFKTGVVSWDGTHPIGEYKIRIIAVNEAQEVQTSVLLQHSFNGNFQGDVDFPEYDPIVPFRVFFDPNGSGTVSVGENGAPSDFGFWTMDGNTISGQYSWSDDLGPYFIEGELTTTIDGAYIDGHYDEGPVNEESGVFRVDFVPE